MNYLESEIRRLKRMNDPRITGKIYKEIMSLISDYDLNCDHFVFNSRNNPIALRNLPDGSTGPVPYLWIRLKTDSDYGKVKTFLPERGGNWNDDWPNTNHLRSRLNEILRKYKLGDDYISDNTFVFFSSFEDLVFDRLGRMCKPAVMDLILKYTNGVEPFALFWHSNRIYFVIMENEQDQKIFDDETYKLASKSISDILRKNDPKEYCTNHDFELKIYHTGMEGINLYGLSRED